MGRISKTAFALLTIVICLTSSFAFQPSIVKGTYTLAQNKVFSLPDTNATIILLNGASYAESDYYIAHNSTNGFYIPSEWYFAMLSTGNGTIDLTTSAYDCNVTIIAFSYKMQNTGGYNFKVNTWLNYTVRGAGNQTLDYNGLYSDLVPPSNPIIYIDGIARQQGNGWSWANFGITVNGALSTVSIYQENVEYLPPRDAPHAPFNCVLGFIAIVILVVFMITTTVILSKRLKGPQNRHQKPELTIDTSVALKLTDKGTDLGTFLSFSQ